jgi:hypothetical protein
MILRSPEYNRSKPPRRQGKRSPLGVPNIQTDATFMRGRLLSDEFGGDVATRRAYEAKARAAGVNPTGKVYSRPLASGPGDPEAWIDGKADVRRICEQRGIGCEGAVTVKGREVEPFDPETARIADDIVQTEVERRLGDNEATPQERADLAERVQADLSPA